MCECHQDFLCNFQARNLDFVIDGKDVAQSFFCAYEERRDPKTPAYSCQDIVNREI